MRVYKKILILLVLICLSVSVTACMEPSTEEIRAKLKDYLYQKYGEEFQVGRIGGRNDDGNMEYTAKIYPKSIIGTSKERDEYYYGSASIDKTSFGGLEKPGDSYGLIKINLGAEEYLLPKINKLFGKKVLLKTDVKYKKRQSNGFYAWYKEPSFLNALQQLKKHPNKRRIELELYLYVFDRIEDKREKEKRREDIFQFAQYLKEEDLFKYLELGVIFIDERVLAESYDSYKWDVEDAPKVEKEMQGETVYLPPMELRKDMSKELQEEVNEMSEKELLANMNEIQKEDLSYKNLDKYYATHYGFIYSAGILKEKYNSSYEKHKKNKTLEHYYYKDQSEVKIGINLEYILDEKGV